MNFPILPNRTFYLITYWDGERVIWKDPALEYLMDVRISAITRL